MSIAILMIFLLIAVSIYEQVHLHSDHTEFSHFPLKKDAAVTDITQKKPSRKSTHIKTTIKFSDGFVFYAYDTQRHGRMISVTPAMTRDMLLRAAIAHEEAYVKQHPEETGHRKTENSKHITPSSEIHMNPHESAHLASNYWICPQCKTSNTQTHCSICGYAKPDSDPLPEDISAKVPTSRGRILCRVIGWMLLILQGISLFSFNLAEFSLISLIGYFIPGMIGIWLVARSYKHKAEEPTDIPKKTAPSNTVNKKIPEDNEIILSSGNRKKKTSQD